MSTAGELLIVEPSERDRDGLRKHFEGLGYMVTAVATGAETRRLVTEKFFPVALIDVDVDGRGAGLEVVRMVRRDSSATGVILLAGRRAFEGAVKGLRLGVEDVVIKAPGEIKYLAERVARVSEAARASRDESLYDEVRGVLDASFKIMLTMCRDTYAHLSMAQQPLRPRILIVDAEQAFVRELAELLDGDDWELAGEMNGGAALDRGAREPFDIIASRDELPDLRGSMVLRTLQAQSPDVLGLLYSSEGEGRCLRIERGETVEKYARFDGVGQLIEKLQEMVDELGSRAQERRFIQAFSADNREFLRRYADLKMKIDRLSS